MAKQGPSPAAVVGINPRHDLKYDITFSVRGELVQLTMGRRLGNRFTKQNVVGSSGLLTWKRRSLVDWQPVPVAPPTRSTGPIGLRGRQRKPQGRPARIFVSYSHEAPEDAEWVATAFESAGANVWRDTIRLRAGASLPDSIAEGIGSSDVFVPLIDEAWLQSEWCLRELRLAKQHGTRVVPIQIHFGKFSPPNAVQSLLVDLGDPVVLNLRRADAADRLLELADELARV